LSYYTGVISRAPNSPSRGPRAAARRRWSCIAAPAVAAALVCAPAVSAQDASLVTFPGGVVWQAALPAPPAFAPAFDPARVFVLLRDGSVTAIDHQTGAPVWTQPQASTVPPAAGAGIVAGADGPRVWARDAASGSVRWLQTLEHPVVTQPLIAGDAVFVPTEAGVVACLQVADGAVRWRQPLGTRPTAAPDADGQRVFTGLLDGRVVALDLRTGAPGWTRALRGKILTVSVVDDRVLAGSNDNFAYLLATKDGDQQWKWRTGGDVIGAAVADARRLYYVSLSNTLLAHNRRNGHLAWKRGLPSRPAGGPVWIGDRVVVAGVAPELRAFKVEDGSPSGTVGVPGRILHRPYLAEASGEVPARLVLVTGGGQVLAIGQTVEPPLVPMEEPFGRRLAPETLGGPGQLQTPARRRGGLAS
jgi:outer membrane protein assembly factor BamB